MEDTTMPDPTVTIDDSRWPVWVMTVREQQTLAGVEAWITAFESALAKQEAFVIVMLNEDSQPSTRPDPAVANRSMTWLNQVRPRIATHCRGVAYALASEESRAIAEQMAAHGDRLYGCPVTVVSTLDQALAWAEDRLAAVM
jgi:hypothetical protein